MIFLEKGAPYFPTRGTRGAVANLSARTTLVHGNELPNSEAGFDHDMLATKIEWAPARFSTEENRA
jgi:hypothetical protein